MKIFRIINSKIRYKLIIGFIFISLFGGVVGYIGFSTIRHIENDYELISKSRPLVQSLEDMRFACLRLISSASEYAYIQTESKNKLDVSPLEQEINLINQSCNLCHQAFSKYENLVQSSFPELTEDKSEIRDYGNKVHIAALEFIELKKKGINGTEALEKKEEMEIDEMGFLKAVDHTLEDTNRKLEKQRVQLISIISSSIRDIVVLSGLTLFLSVLFGFLYARSLANPITKLTQLADGFSKGNLDVAIDIKSNDEISVLGKSFNEMAERIKLLIIQLEDEVNLVKRAEEKLIMYAHIFRSINEVINVADLNDNILFVNPAFCKTYGYSEEELIGTNSSIFWSERNPKEVVEQILPATLKGGWKGELLNKRKDGTEFPIYLSTSVIKNDSGEVIALVGVAEDITERKQTVFMIQKQNNELKELNATKDKFFSIIAHDLRSPFQGFLAMTAMMSENIGDFSDEELAKNLGEMNKSAQNLYKLLQNLLEWARIQNGTIEFEPKYYMLKEIIEQNIESINEMAKQKGVTIISEIPESQKVFADENMINTILRNLISNAVKFTRKEGIVTAKSRTINNDTLEISVHDTGVGMSGSTLLKLFKTGEKVGCKGTDGEASTGLGLLLCKEFVEKHRGKIWAVSEEGKGSTFTFNLPMR